MYQNESPGWITDSRLSPFLLPRRTIFCVKPTTKQQESWHCLEQ